MPGIGPLYVFHYKHAWGDFIVYSTNMFGMYILNSRKGNNCDGGCMYFFELYFVPHSQKLRELENSSQNMLFDLCNCFSWYENINQIHACTVHVLTFVSVTGMAVLTMPSSITLWLSLPPPSLLKFPGSAKRERAVWRIQPLKCP